MKLMSEYLGLCLVLCIGAVTASTLHAQPPADTNYDEQKVPSYTLPAIFPVGVSDDEALRLWKSSRRAEILTLFEEHVYGRTPSGSLKIQSEVLEESDEALGGLAKRQQVRLTLSSKTKAKNPKSISIDVLVYTPSKAKAAVPAFMGLNFYGNQTVHPDPNLHISQKWMRGNSNIGIVKSSATEKTRGVYKERWQVELLLKRGYGLVTMYCGDIDPDNYRHDFSDGVHPLFYAPGQTNTVGNDWGAIGAWAWGLTTVRSWLDSSKVIDANRIAVVGHSRLGKAALWAGAQDSRFAMVVSNNSGCGGASLYRRCYGERIHHMLKPVGYWFCKNHAKYALKESELPVDQHMLMSLIAPRPLYVASAVEDTWADPQGEYLSAKHASSVYKLYGTSGLPSEEYPAVDSPVTGKIGYHVRSGKHDITKYDWQQYLKFADEQL